MNKLKKPISQFCVYLFAGFYVSGAIGAEPPKTMLLECSYESTIDLKDGSASETIGKKLVTIKNVGGSKISLIKEATGAEFVGVMSDAEIFAEATFHVSGIRVKESFKINRYTGQFENPFLLGAGGLIHSGHCSAAQKKF
jgi:hypothetical protein